MNIVYIQQNSDNILLLLFLQRKKYEFGELMNWVSWIPVLFSTAYSIFAYFTDGNVSIRVIVAMLGYLSLLINRLYITSIEVGACSKAAIDSNLFGFKYSEKYSFDNLMDMALELKIKKNKEFDIQTKNTGDDEPRGVKNWYTPTDIVDRLEVIYSCQKENIFWNKRLSKAYIHLVILFSVILFSFVILIGLLTGISLKDAILLILFSSSLIVKIINEYLEYSNYTKAHMIADKVIEMIESDGISENMLVCLQKEIHRIRLSRFLVPKLFHTLKSGEIHKQIREKIAVRK